VVGTCGPRENKNLAANPESMAFDISVRSGAGTPTALERLMESTLLYTLARVVDVDLFPSHSLSISVGVLSDDGGAFAAVINAVMFAVIDLGINLKRIAFAACVSFDDADCKDIQMLSEKRCGKTLTQVFCMLTNQILFSYHTGDIKLENIRVASSRCLDLARQNARRYYLLE
jgi:ribonuclease PH